MPPPEPKPLTLFVLGFGPPKPLHRLIVEHWKLQPSAHFELVTDHPGWRPLVGTATNVSIVETSVEDYFARAFDLLGCSTPDDFYGRYGVVFHQDRLPMNGWTACALRPLLGRIHAVDSPWWGWLDYDVLFDHAALAHALGRPDIDGFYFPTQGPHWEQFKVFRSSSAVDEDYLRIAGQHASRQAHPGRPLEADLLYHLRETGRLRFDECDMGSIAVHWPWTNRQPMPSIQTDVALGADMISLAHAPTGRPLIFFVADVQVKLFSEAQVDGVFEDLRTAGRHVFPFEGGGNLL